MAGDAELSAKSAKRVVGRPFPKGVSGCPGGRPRQDVTELARAHTREAIQALVAALKRPKEAVPAAIALLDRGWGEPTLSISSEQSITSLHLVAARLVGEKLQAELGVTPPPSEPQPNIIDLTALPPATE
jgi:hypothetical protein